MRKFIASLAVAVTAVSSPIAAGAAVPPPRASLGVSTNIAIPNNLLAIQFTDSAGHSHTFRDLHSTTLVVPFLTLCPEVCPFTSGNAIQVARHLRESHTSLARVVCLSVDPERDTPKRLAAYRKLIGLNGTHTPIALWRASSEDTATFMKFFGMTTDRMKADPSLRDWWTHKPLKYDLDHSDGFYVISKTLHLRYISGLGPRFVGTLTKSMERYLSKDGLNTLRHPLKGWSPKDALAAMSYVAKRPL